MTMSEDYFAVWLVVWQERDVAMVEYRVKRNTSSFYAKVGMVLGLVLMGVVAQAQSKALVWPIKTFENEPAEMFVADDHLYFSGALDGTGDQEPWISGGSLHTTRQVIDVIPGSGGSFPKLFSYSPRVKEVGGWEQEWGFNSLFFVIEKTVTEPGLNGLFTMAPGGTSAFQYDVPDFLSTPGMASFKGVQALCATARAVAFSADVSGAGRELVVMNTPYRSGAPTLYRRLYLADIFPGVSGSSPSHITVRYGEYENYRSYAFAFSADNGVGGREYVVWRSDTETFQYHDLRPGSTGSHPLDFTLAQKSDDHVLFFTADNGTHGRELWRDDCKGNVHMVKDIRPGGASSPSDLTARDLSTSIFFVALSAAHGRELWKSDGTEAGTVLVKDIRPGADSSLPGHLCGHGQSVCFSADDGVHGVELWKSNGTEAGTLMVKDIRPGPGSSYPRDLILFDGKLYFTADPRGDGDREVWVSDFTEAGTRPIQNWREPGANPRNLTAGTERLYFTEGNTLYALHKGGIEGPAAPVNLQGGPVYGDIQNTGQITISWEHNGEGTAAWDIHFRKSNVPAWDYHTLPGASRSSLFPTDLMPELPPNSKIEFAIRGIAYGPDRYGMFATPSPFFACNEAQWPVLGENVATMAPLSTEGWHGNQAYQFYTGQPFCADYCTASAFRCTWTTQPPWSFYPYAHLEQRWDSDFFDVTPDQGSGAYYLYVRSENQCGDISEYFETIGPFRFDADPPTQPGKPSGGGHRTLGGTDRVLFHWTEATDALTGVDFYECEIQNVTDGVPVFFENVGENLHASFTAESGKTYRARVRATDGVGNTSGWSAWSDPVTAGTYGGLQVDLSPAAAITQGAGWRRKGTTSWRSSGSGPVGAWESHVVAGPVTIEFKPIEGWLRPAEKTVTVVVGETTVTSGTYKQHGYVTVTIEPAAARAAGAQWRRFMDPKLPQREWRNSGETESAAEGNHLIEFKPIPCWGSPAGIVVSVAQNETVSRTGTYTEYTDTGAVQVTLLPAEAVAAGAKWRVEGTGEWLDSGDINPCVAAGPITIQYKPIWGWSKPADGVFTLPSGSTLATSAAYSQTVGSLRVDLSPPEAVAEGARWRYIERLPEPEPPSCETFVSTDVPQQGGSWSLNSEIQVNAPGRITGLLVQIDLTHENVEQVSLELEGPDGVIYLFDQNNSGSNMTNTGFSDDAFVGIWQGQAPFTGVYQPVQPLSDFYGTNAAGVWTLYVADSGELPTTRLNAWSLCITTDAMPETKFSPGTEAEKEIVIGPWTQSGVVVENLPVAYYRIQYDTLPGWITPAPDLVHVTLNTLTTLVAEYSDKGALTVNLTPAAAVAAGAQWRMAGDAVWRDSGTTADKLAPGEYEIEFKDLVGWTRPSKQTMLAYSGVSTESEGIYLAHAGLLRVNIEPDEALDAGARWRMLGSTEWRWAGDVAEAELGIVTVEFEDIPGWTPPENQQATLSVQNEMVTITAVYTDGREADVAPRPDGDGALLVNDWVQVGRFVAGLDVPAEGSEFQRADCAPLDESGDGQLLVNDWVQAGRYVAGLDAQQEQGGPTGPQP